MSYGVVEHPSSVRWYQILQAFIFHTDGLDFKTTCANSLQNSNFFFSPYPTLQQAYLWHSSLLIAPYLVCVSSLLQYTHYIVYWMMHCPPRSHHDIFYISPCMAKWLPLEGYCLLVLKRESQSNLFIIWLWHSVHLPHNFFVFQSFLIYLDFHNFLYI